MTQKTEITNTDVLLLHNALSRYIEDEQADVSEETTAHREQLLNKLAQLFGSAPTTFIVEQALRESEQPS